MRGGRRPRLSLGALAALLVLGAAGCATGPERRPPALGGVTPTEVDGLVQRWEAQWRQFTGLRAAVDLTVVRRGNAERTAGVVLLSPTELRFEVIAPLGFPTLVVVAGPERVLVWSPAERKAWTARPTPEALARWIGVPLPLDTLIRLLVGFVPPPPDGVPVRVDEDGGPHLVFQQGPRTERVWVTRDGQPARFELEDGRRVTTTFERALAGPLEALGVEAPGQSLELHLRYMSGEYVTPPAGAFDLTIPDGIPIERVD